MPATWLFTVASLTNSASAISALLVPRASCLKTSASRAVNRDNGSADESTTTGGRAKRSTRRRVMEGALGALNAGQRQALAYASVRQFAMGFGFSLVFFAGFCVLTGVLIRRSRLVPRVLGAMMIVAGACYVVSSVAALLSPPLSAQLVPWILMPILLAELSLALWLTARGVDPAPPAWTSVVSTKSPPDTT